jgi:hypothetical protein
VRSALTAVEGVSDIQTDPNAEGGPICIFKFANADLDIQAKLDELAANNTHIKGWSMAN